MNNSKPIEITQGISVNHNVLKFNSVDTYQNFIETKDKEGRKIILDKIKDSNFKNYFSNENQKGNTEEMDNFFGQLLNKNGIIQIGDFLYQINVKDEKVFAIKSKEDNKYALSLETLKEKGNGVLSFSTTDNVLVLTQRGGVEAKCSEDGVGSRSSSASQSDGIASQGIVTTLRHSKFGIYFTIIMESVSTQQAGPFFTYEYEFYPSSSKRRYKRRCKSWEYTGASAESMVSVNSFKYKIDESAFRNYSKYDIKARCKVYGTSPISHQYSLLSTSSWIEIRVNI